MLATQQQQRGFSARTSSSSSRTSSKAVVKIARSSSRHVVAVVAKQQQQQQQPTSAASASASTASPLQRASTALLSGLVSAALLLPGAAHARLEGVNRPDLLPKGDAVETVIDVAGFLTPSEERRIASEIAALEADTGFRLRVLAQSYPETPGLAVRDYWAVDDNTVVFVADPTFANIININVGAGVDLEVPQSFWSRLAGKYGNKFFWQERGEAASITNAVSAIDSCLREPSGRNKCATVQGEFDADVPSAGAKKGGLFGL